MEDVLQVRAPALNFHVLRDSDGLYLIDAGFLGGRILLRRALANRGWDKLPIRGILVTHGHLDHVANVAALAEEHQAWVAAPRLDELHYLGKYPYRGAARVCGWLEAVGRVVCGYRPFHVDRWLDDGEDIDVWHGLRVVALPGHTVGHVGFYCARLKLLFCADLFASYRGVAHLPPAIFNSCPGEILPSVRKALALDLEGVLPNHADRAEPRVHLARLRALMESKARSD